MTTSPLLLVSLIVFPAAAAAQPFAITLHSVPCGGATTPVAAGPYALAFTIGDPIAAPTTSAGLYSLSAGFLAAGSGGSSCYANCDGSAGNPLLTANDFQCFLDKFAAGDPYANCDGSTGNPTLTANDFQCFLNSFAAGCQ